MRINIKATNIELTEALRAYTEDKVRMIEKLLPAEAAAIAEVEVGKETQHHKNGEVFRGEINLEYSGQHLYAVEHASDLYAAVDLVKDEMARLIKDRQEKKNTLMRRGGRKIKNMLRRLNPWSD